jgi:THO complex subunit 5
MESEISNLRKIASELVLCKDPSNVKNRTSDGLLSILRLKAANKSLAHATEDLKEETSKSKGSLEAADLQLQNLLYEKQYYEKEINACRSFQSAFPDSQIALLHESEFWSSADEDLQAKAKLTGNDHELMLQRLAHEMRLRRKMATDLEALKAAKAAKLQAIGSQEKILRQLGGSLKALEDTARPLQVFFSYSMGVRSLWLLLIRFVA